MRPFVALRRGVEVELLEDEVALAEVFTTQESMREMAWDARLNRRGNTLVLFQVFFLSLVRPERVHHAGEPSWEELKREYDRRLGFPSERMSEGLVNHFAEVHRVVSLRGAEGWLLFFRLLGFGEVSFKEI